MSQPSVRLDGVTKAFGDLIAVREIDLDIPQGEFFTLLGPSGCGKTTTLRLVAGFEQPTGGRILIEGSDVAGMPPHRRPTNTVFQSYALFPHLNVRENVAYGLRRKKVPRDEIRRRVEAELARVGMAGEINRRPNQLSGGMQQRVALARALVNLPKVLLLDEPLGALDLKLRRQMQLELKTIQEEVGLTFLHVTHDQEEAMTMADTVAVMNKGAIEQMGAPAELYELPRTVFVANFLGQSNLFTGEVVGTTDAAITVDIAGIAGMRLIVPTARAQRHQGQVTIGVRPEKVALHRDAPVETSDRNTLGPGHVIDVSFSGVSTQYIVAMPGAGTMTVFAQNIGSGPVASEGDEVWLSWDVEHGFGLDDEPSEADRFPADDTTSSIAVQRREALVAELEEH